MERQTVTGAVVVDAGIMIGLLDRGDAHHHDSVEAMARLADEGKRLFTSALTLGEALVKPAGIGPAAADAAKETIVKFAGVSVLPVDEMLSVDIATIRAQTPSLKIPDAVVVASARAIGAGQLLTTDHRLAKIDEAITPKQLLAM